MSMYNNLEHESGVLAVIVYAALDTPLLFTEWFKKVSSNFVEMEDYAQLKPPKDITLYHPHYVIMGHMFDELVYHHFSDKEVDELDRYDPRKLTYH